MASRWAAYDPAALGLARPAGLEIRPALADDCPPIAAIEASRNGADVEAARRRCEAQATDPDVLLLAALVDGEVVGFGRAGRLRSACDAPADQIPDGWYLLGLVVVDAWRRRGIGLALTERRIGWLLQRTDAVYYFVNARNRASLDLHKALGFVEVTRQFSAPGISFEGGEGVLCRLETVSAAERALLDGL